MLLVALAAGLASLTACGGGGGGSGGSSGAGDPSTDKTTADKIVLKQADFPSGWTAKAHQASPDDAANKKRFFECIGAPDPAATETADVRSPDFSQGQLTQAASEVQFVRTENDAVTELAALQGGKTVDCIKTLIHESAQKQLPAGTAVTDLTAAQLKFPTLKDGAAAVRVSFTIQTGGVNVPIYADAIYFRSGRALMTLTTVNGGSPMDAKLEESLAQKMAGRA
jgi:hypothetical protein